MCLLYGFFQQFCHGGSVSSESYRGILSENERNFTGISMNFSDINVAAALQQLNETITDGFQKSEGNWSSQEIGIYAMNILIIISQLWQHQRLGQFKSSCRNSNGNECVTIERELKEVVVDK